MAVNPLGWSTTAASNVALDGISTAENVMTVAAVNNAFRSTMAGIKELTDLIMGAKTSAGTADVQTLTTGLSLSAYAVGQMYAFKAGSLLTNTGAMTLNVDGLGAKSVKRVDGNNPSAADVTAGGIYLTAYDGTNIQLLNPTTISTSTFAQQGKQTIWVPASAMTARTTNGAASGTAEMTTNKNMFSTKDFDTSTQEFVQFEIWFPKSWNLSTVTFQPQWSHAATSSNFGVVWGLAGIARSDDDAGDVAFGTAQTSADTGGTTNDIYLGPESAAITIAGTPASGDTVQFQLNRTVADGSDTMAIDARLHGIRLFFTTNAATDA